ncbi:MAG: N-acetylmuramoyl-L-alanine amidase [Elusimicrobia bacterium]|nr:N-acetylmuramoyl-L-alanine amidase [Elusimicrobiota bacterium]
MTPAIFAVIIALCAFDVQAAAAAPAVAIKRVPFSIQVFPQKESVNIWAYRQGPALYIPAGSLSRVLRAKVRRYNQRSSIVLVLQKGKVLEFFPNQKRFVFGKKAVTLKQSTLSTPDGKDLLIPFEAIDHPNFEAYADIEVELEETRTKMRVYPVIEVQAPTVGSQDQGWFIEFKLPSLVKNYEITFHPADPPKTARLAVRFPYSRIAGEKNQSAPGAAPVAWFAQHDALENSLIFKFSLPESVAFSDIDASESLWPFKKLQIAVVDNGLQGASKFSPRGLPSAPRPARGGPKPVPELKSPKSLASKPAPVGARRTSHAAESIRGRRYVIVIDPGHGGRDGGTSNKWGTKEKQMTLRFAKKVEAVLAKKLAGSKIFLTRDDDRTLELPARVRFAQAKKADAFVSLHMNASQAKNKGGFEIYIPSYINSHRSSRALLYECEKLALGINRSLERRLAGRLSSRGIIKGDFHVLRENAMPAVLIEAGFLTHQNDYQLLMNNGFQDTFAQAAAQGIVDYLKNSKQ